MVNNPSCHFRGASLQSVTWGCPVRLDSLPTPYLEEGGCAPCGTSVLLVSQPCATLCDPVDCSPTGSSVHGILQARIPEWVAVSLARVSCQPRDQNHNSCSFCIGRLIHLLSQQGQVEACSLSVDTLLLSSQSTRVTGFLSTPRAHPPTTGER